MILVLRTAFVLLRPVGSMTEAWQRHRADTFTWRDFLCADDDELYAGIMWCRRRKGMHKDLPPLTDRTKPPTRDDFYFSLLDTEKQRHSDFIAEHSVEHCVCSLGQDPLFTRAASGEDCLHTLVRNPGLLWMEEYGRWQSVRRGLSDAVLPTVLPRRTHR